MAYLLFWAIKIMLNIKRGRVVEVVDLNFNELQGLSVFTNFINDNLCWARITDF